MKPLQASLLFFIRNFGRPLGRVELAKLAYLSDCEAFVRTGKTLNKVAYFRENHGPYNAAIPDALSELESQGIIAIQTDHLTDGALRVSHTPATDAPNPQEFVSPSGLDVLRAVLAMCKDMNMQEIMDQAYKTEPMMAVLRNEEAAGKTLVGQRLDLARLVSSRKRFTGRELRVALAGTLGESIGSDEQYAHALFDEWEQWKSHLALFNRELDL